MAKVKITGHASGTGVLTVTAPNTSTDRTITLPDSTGTILDENSSLPAANLTGTVADARFPATLPAISGASLTGVYTTLGSNSHSKVIATTYDLSTASGNKDITGFGYDPKLVLAFWGQSSSGNWGWGFMQITQNVGYCIRNIGGSTTGQVDQESGLLAHKTNSSGGIGQVGVMSSITDGVRIAFTKTGSPTGTLYIKLIGFL
jgi:hypothetical protein